MESKEAVKQHIIDEILSQTDDDFSEPMTAEDFLKSLEQDDE